VLVIGHWGRECRRYAAQLIFSLYPALRLRLRAGLSCFVPSGLWRRRSVFSDFFLTDMPRAENCYADWPTSQRLGQNQFCIVKGRARQGGTAVSPGRKSWVGWLYESRAGFSRRHKRNCPLAGITRAPLSHFFRSTRNFASSRRVFARSPNWSSAASA